MNFLPKDAIVARLKCLPALPSIVCDLLASFNQDDMDVGQLSRQIAKDQALTACLLRIANSSFYGLQCRVATINDAVVLVGFRAVRSMVLAVSVNSVFRADQCPGFDPNGYIRHSIGTGLGARALAVLSERNPELAFTAGVLHDIGELALASCFAEQYTRRLPIVSIMIVRWWWPSVTYLALTIQPLAACWPNCGTFHHRCTQLSSTITPPPALPPTRWPISSIFRMPSLTDWDWPEAQVKWCCPSIRQPGNAFA